MTTISIPLESIEALVSDVGNEDFRGIPGTLEDARERIRMQNLLRLALLKECGMTVENHEEWLNFED